MPSREIFPTATDLREFLDDMDDLEVGLGKLLPAGETDLDGPAETLATELFSIARGTFGTVRLIMNLRLTSRHPDRTEDAAVLVRRLLEIYARVAFIAADSPDKNTNALRCELLSARRLERALRELVEDDSNTIYAERHQEWKGKIEQIKRSLVERAGKAKQAPTTTDIFKDIGGGYPLLWRQFSDVLHADLVGRSFHVDGTTIGVPATPVRQRFVMSTSISVMVDTARCWQWCLEGM